MTYTGEQIVRMALMPLGIVGAGQPLKALDLQDGMIALNGMISLFRTKTLLIPYEGISEYDLIADQQAYTLGPGGDFDQARPTFIRAVGIVLDENGDNTEELQLSIIGPQEWPFVTIKAQTSTFPTAVYPQMTYPLATLHFWPVPTETRPVRLYFTAHLDRFADATTAYDFPDGYGEVLIYSLCKRLALNYGVPFPADAKELLADAMLSVAATNQNFDILSVDRALRSPQAIYDWRTDQGVGGRN